MDGTTNRQVDIDAAFRRWPCVGRTELVERLAAALANGRVDGVVLRGALGVGKTRLAEEVAASLNRKGLTVHRLTATATAGRIGYGVVAHLLPPGTADDPLVVGQVLAAALAPSAGSARSVIFVDDLPNLDGATAGALATLVANGAVGLLGTTRDGDRQPPELAGLVGGNDRIATVTVEPLERSVVETLLHLALGGPVDAAALTALAEPAAGNPLFLRELTLSAIEAGTLERVADVWRLRGPLPPTPRLREMVEARLRAFGPEATAALELLALCQPIALDDLEAIVGIDALEELERHAMLAVDGTPLGVQLAHPFHAEAIRLGIPPLRTRLTLRRYLDHVGDRPPADLGERVRRARWQVAAGVAVPAEELLEAARAAHAAADWTTVAELLTPVFAADPTWEVGLFLGQALFESGDFHGAARTLGRAAELAPEPSQRVDVTCLRANVLLWGAATEHGAIAALDEAAAAPDLDGEQRRRLAGERAATLVIAGDPARALVDIEGPDRGGRDNPAFGSPSHVVALACAGRTDDAIAEAEAARAARRGEVLPGLAAPDTILTTLAWSHMEAGDLAQAMALADEGLGRAVVSGMPLPQYWFAMNLGRAHLIAGHADESRRWFQRARALAVDIGLGPSKRPSLMGAAAAAALLGEPGGVDVAARELDDCPAFGFLAPEETIARAWIAVARGELVAARSMLLGAVDHAVTTGHRTAAAWLLHDAARLGAARDALDRITELAATTQSDLVRARAEHVAALAAGDADALAACVDRFEALGCDLYAAEAAVAAGDAYRRRNEQRAASAMVVRAEELGRRCAGARTPALATATTSVVPLTEREREIALLASTGMPSREIADRLFLSYRTVNNHLQRVFDKLGINRRTDLVAALGVDTEAAA